MSALSPPAALGAQLRSSRRAAGARRALAAAPPRPAASRCTRTTAAAAAPADKYKVPVIDAARARMYEATFAGVGAPEWNEATCVSNREVSPGVRVVTLEVEVSREVVPIRGAYTGVGRQAKVKVGPNPERLLTICSPPFPPGAGTPDAGDAAVDKQQRVVLFKLRNDMSANATKTLEEVISIRAPLQLYLGPKEAPEVAGMQPGEVCQTGYFTGGGLQLRPLLGIFRFPVLLIFAAGRGMATAKALVECPPTAGLTIAAREDVRLYCSAPVDAELPFQEQYASWEASGCKVRPAVLTPSPGSAFVTGGVRESFDADDVMYDPALTGAIVLGDEAFEKEVLELLEDAGIPREHTVLGSVEAPLVDYMRSVKFAAEEEA